MASDDEPVRTNPFSLPGRTVDPAQLARDLGGPRPSGRYQIGERLGAGGMGEVHRATDPALGRRVAFKRLHTSDPAQLARFVREARITAQLAHPNIVPVHELATDADGQPYYTMKEIEGRTLGDCVEAGEHSPSALLQIFLKVCDALAFAHARGVIHRDLKPANIMIGAFGEVLVVDWGLAKVTGETEAEPISPDTPDPDGGALETVAGEVMGTPAYMPPEQADGRIPDLDVRSDVYALGAILYQILTGLPPFEGESVHEVLTAVAQGKLVPPSERTRERAIPWELEAAVMRAMARRRGERYAVVEEIKQDIEAYLEGRRLVAADYTALQRLVKWSKRHRVGVTAGAIVVVVTGIVTGVAFAKVLAEKREAERQRVIAVDEQGEANRHRGIAKGKEVEARKAERDAHKEKVRAEKALARAMSNLVDAYAYAARSAWSANDVAGGKMLAARSLLLRENEPARSLLMGQSRSLPPRLEASFEQHLGSMPAVLDGVGFARILGFSPDGRRVVTAQHDTTAQIWDVMSGKELAVLRGHSRWVYSAVFSPDGRRVVTASMDGTARIWDAESGKAMAVLRGQGRVIPAFSPDGRRVVTAGRTARIWDARNGKLLEELRVHGSGVSSAIFSPDGLRIVTASMDTTARIWDAATGKQLAVLGTPSTEPVTIGISTVFSPDGRRIVTASPVSAARIWDAMSGKEVAVLGRQSKSQVPAAFSPDGRWIVTGASGDNAARIWDATSGKELAVLKGGSPVFSPDGRRVVTVSWDKVSWDKTVRIWSATSGTELDVLRGHGNVLYSAIFTADGRRIVAWGTNSARIWEATRGKEGPVLRGHASWVTSAVFSPDGSRIVTASEKTARIWDARSGTELAVVRGHGDDVGSVCFSPDGRRIVTASLDNTARIWDARSGKNLLVLRGHGDWARSAVFSPDGRRIVTSSSDKTARIWDATSGNELAVLRGHRNLVTSAAFSPDGRRIVTASPDGTARIWDATGGQELAVLSGHGSAVESAAFSPDGRRVVTSSFDKLVRIWDATNGKELAVLRGHRGWVRSAVFSPDGRRIVSASRDSTARIWDATTGKELAILRGHGSWVGSAVFSPDGHRIVTVPEDKTARIWDAPSGKELAVLHGHGGKVTCAAFSPDGCRIITASADKTARIWTWESPRKALIRLKIDTGRTLAGFRIVPEPILRLPEPITRLAGQPAVPGWLRTAFPSRYPTPKAISRTRDLVLSARDPALTWLAVFTALGGRPRSNAYRLLVLESLEEALEERGAKDSVLALVLAATRGAKIEVLRAAVKSLPASARQHPIVRAIG